MAKEEAATNPMVTQPAKDELGRRNSVQVQPFLRAVRTIQTCGWSNSNVWLEQFKRVVGTIQTCGWNVQTCGWNNSNLWLDDSIVWLECSSGGGSVIGLSSIHFWAPSLVFVATITTWLLRVVTFGRGTHPSPTSSRVTVTVTVILTDHQQNSQRHPMHQI
jgi:hypothetical protein